MTTFNPNNYKALDTSIRRALYVATQRYAWPGGYELFAVMSDGECLCHQCCAREARTIYRNGPDRRSGWYVEAISTTADCDTEEEFCAHCNRVIYQPEEDVA